MKKIICAIVFLIAAENVFAAQAALNVSMTPPLYGTVMATTYNAGLNALSTFQAGTTTPTSISPNPVLPYSWWADTTSGFMKGRDSSNTSWTTLFPLNTRLATQAETQNASNLSSGLVSASLLPPSFVPSKASTLAQGGGGGTAMTFNWAGQSGQPSWLWGSNDGSNIYVWNPSNFNVNYANSAGSATTAGSASNQATGAATSPGWTNINQASGLKIRYGTTALGNIPSYPSLATATVSYTAVSNLIGVYVSVQDTSGSATTVCSTDSWTNSSFVVRCIETAAVTQNVAVVWFVLGN